jgi:hypothetical protein
MSKSKVKKKTKKIVQHYIEFGSIEYDDACKEFRSVKLDGKVIYKMDQERFMGHLKDKSPEVCEAISKELGIEFTKSDLNDARKNGGFFNK